MVKRVFCEGCTFLSLSEFQQDELKNQGIQLDHHCKKYGGKRVFHYGYHPDLPILNECNEKSLGGNY